MAKTLVCIALRLCIAGTLVVTNVVNPPPAKASVIGDFTGILTDPLKLGRASDNILQSVERVQAMLNQVGALEATTNVDLANRISDVKDIVDEVIGAVDHNVANLGEIVKQAEDRMASLEQIIFIDAQSILDRVQCVAENMATVQIQEAVANAVATLVRSDPHIALFGIKIIDLKAGNVQITDPDKAYMSLRDGYLKRLAALRATDSAYAIVSTYANIERLAQGASCAYRDPTLAAFFLKQEFDYQRLAEPWSIIPPVMQQ
jgi:hypothetical protein